jgi:hypothetical protein
MYEIHYNFSQLEKAAEFIFNNNSSCCVWPSPACSAYDVRIQIEQMIRRVAAENMVSPSAERDANWTTWTGTGGFFLVFTSDDDYSIDVSIYVDPAIGTNTYRYMTEVVD